MKIENCDGKNFADEIYVRNVKKLSINLLGESKKYRAGTFNGDCRSRWCTNWAKQHLKALYVLYARISIIVNQNTNSATTNLHRVEHSFGKYFCANITTFSGKWFFVQLELGWLVYISDLSEIQGRNPFHGNWLNCSLSISNIGCDTPVLYIFETECKNMRNKLIFTSENNNNFLMFILIEFVMTSQLDNLECRNLLFCSSKY